MKIALHWFRCDLRLSDNTALLAASKESDVVVPVFIFDPAILSAPDIGAPIVAFMIECLRSLEKNIEVAGGRLIFRHGPVVQEMSFLLRETGAQALHYNRDYEPYARERDAAVEKLAHSMGVEVCSHKDGVIHEPDEILKDDGRPYRVFTPYSHAWRARLRSAVLPAVKFARLSGFKPPKSIPLPTMKQLGFSTSICLPPAGERAGRESLGRFMAEDVLQYASRRDFPAEEGTSRLSPHIRMGTLSPRTVVAMAEKAAEAHPKMHPHAETFVKEMIWRDFYRQVLWHFPHVATSSFKPEFNELKWENDKRFFDAWCEGRTGFPLVDAGMRQLNAKGWMHNRLRMITATFLTKDLLISWQWGERYFMQKLIDADLASNNGGWQWCAGTGTDAQPYFRIFNPISQARKFDPEGVFIRRYVPEADTLAYPAPIVDHARQRLKALALYKRL
ncbi:MAG: DNA photolyase family protein [Methylacidiphilales bacterium]|nr:DNA photolyase family protein [Candidatus Methylacidiphilales bacterium]